MKTIYSFKSDTVLEIKFKSLDKMQKFVNGYSMEKSVNELLMIGLTMNLQKDI